MRNASSCIAPTGHAGIEDHAAGPVASSRGARPVPQISPDDALRRRRADTRHRAAARRVGRGADRQRLRVLRPNRLRENGDRANYGPIAQLCSGTDSPSRAARALRVSRLSPAVREHRASARARIVLRTDTFGRLVTNDLLAGDYVRTSGMSP